MRFLFLTFMDRKRGIDFTLPAGLRSWVFESAEQFDHLLAHFILLFCLSFLAERNLNNRKLSFG